MEIKIDVYVLNEKDEYINIIHDTVTDGDIIDFARERLKNQHDLRDDWTYIPSIDKVII